MIRPPVNQETQPSPLDSLAATIGLLAKNRQYLTGLSQSLGELSWRVLLEDLEMLVTEHVVVGLRTPWARRVAVPILNAVRALNNEHGDDQERARFALDILRQCTDEKVRDACINWVKGKYHV